MQMRRTLYYPFDHRATPPAFRDAPDPGCFAGLVEPRREPFVAIAAAMGALPFASCSTARR